MSEDHQDPEIFSGIFEFTYSEGPTICLLNKLFDTLHTHSTTLGAVCRCKAEAEDTFQFTHVR